MDPRQPPMGKDSRYLPSLSTQHPRTGGDLEQRHSAASSPFTRSYKDYSPSETTMASRDSPSSREPPNPLDRWPSRSESGSSFQSPYTPSASVPFPHAAPGTLRPAEPGAFSTETWGSRPDTAKGPGVGDPTTLPRPFKRPSSPDYWSAQPSSKQRSFVTGPPWTGQVAVPQPGPAYQPPDM